MTDDLDLVRHDRERLDALERRVAALERGRSRWDMVSQVANRVVESFQDARSGDLTSSGSAAVLVFTVALCGLVATVGGILYALGVHR